jgi:hypothetical protein
MEENTRGKSRLASLLTAGLIAGAIAAVINVCYMFLYESMTGFSLREFVNILSVSISSIVPGAIAGLILFGLLRTKPANAVTIFIIVMIICTIISFIGPLSNELPNGEEMPAEFAGLTIPMHILAPLTYVIVLLQTLKKSR